MSWENLKDIATLILEKFQNSRVAAFKSLRYTSRWADWHDGGKVAEYAQLKDDNICIPKTLTSELCSEKEVLVKWCTTLLSIRDCINATPQEITTGYMSKSYDGKLLYQE